MNPIAVLRWMDWDWRRLLDLGIAEAVLQAAEPELLYNYEYRQRVLSLDKCRICLPDGIRRQLEGERRAKERAQRNAADMRKRHREDNIRLIGLPFSERVQCLADEANLSFSVYESRKDWNAMRSQMVSCTENELMSYDEEEVQKLMDYCVDLAIFSGSEVLKRLYDRRHDLRLVAIDRLREKYGSLSPSEQLRLFVGIPSLPIENYPPELAGLMTVDWIRSLSEEKRIPLLKKLERTRLGIWKDLWAKYSSAVVPT